MPRPNEPQQPKPRHLRLLPAPPPVSTKALPVVVPLLRPDQPVTPAEETLLADIARQARRGDAGARDLLWRSFEARLEATLYRCGRMTWQQGWARRNGRPWELDDLRQEAWLVFSDLVMEWNGEGGFAPYVIRCFPLRLRRAIRDLGPMPRAVRLPVMTDDEPDPEGGDMRVEEDDELLAAVQAALSPRDALVLQMRIADELSLSEIARRLVVSRRTMVREWARIRRVARTVVKARLRREADLVR